MWNISSRFWVLWALQAANWKCCLFSLWPCDKVLAASLQHALTLDVTEVDVNEQNPNATAFYLKHGFEMISRSKTDSEGNPYPILHLQLKN